LEGKEYLGHCTNNIAEYKALILGLKGALAEGYNNLEVYLDSELLANQINGSYRVKNENLKVLMNEVRGLLTSFDSIQVKHVLRSSNSHADRLANLAIDTHI
jgi:ribonuclease HI